MKSAANVLRGAFVFRLGVTQFLNGAYHSSVPEVKTSGRGAFRRLVLWTIEFHLDFEEEIGDFSLLRPTDAAAEGSPAGGFSLRN